MRRPSGRLSTPIRSSSSHTGQVTRGTSLLLVVESSAQTVQRGGEAVVPQTQMRPSVADVLRGLLDGHALLANQPAAQHQTSARRTTVAVHEDLAALGAQRGQVVEDV